MSYTNFPLRKHRPPYRWPLTPEGNDWLVCLLGVAAVVALMLRTC